MNINDPFGRIESKRQKEYESLRLSLQKIGLTNRDEAEVLLKKLRRRGTWGLAIILPIVLLLMLALPELRFLFVACGGLAAFWVIKTVLNSQEYVKRYIQEELSDPGESF
ncbi:MAG: hypothetical protein C0616_09150 [Desulfuromonas sp.]|nr:MAG: hypothetical protein C0616_09150 [Desulfuromonas sp.]